MGRRQAQIERLSQLLEREPRPEGELDRHHEILGVQLHPPSVLSIFRKMEYGPFRSPKRWFDTLEPAYFAVALRVA
jgi:hypothetical protein